MSLFKLWLTLLDNAGSSKSRSLPMFVAKIGVGASPLRAHRPRPASQQPPQNINISKPNLPSSIISLLGRTAYHWPAKATTMFYSESLLSKTGPLARVWLSANLERKLSKTHILQSDIKSSVGAIVDQGQAPMALRLSGQLLLGVVRIYKRQAGYLLDDCNDALVKIKMVQSSRLACHPTEN
jgi:hypothetical protein